MAEEKVINFKVIEAVNGHVIEGAGQRHVAKNEAEIGEAVLEIVKASGRGEPKKKRGRGPGKKKGPPQEPATT